ncbi:MAG: amino acid adenylation domain-containing protein [Gammaproteobacteria bacterium]|nr:amino acid adenylation domain-containing protein [Gammaproteobacteria bacterium]
MHASEIEDIFELTPTQSGLLLQSIREEGTGVYLEQMLFELEGDLDPDRLQRAVDFVVARHDALRISAHWQALEHPLQVVARSVELSWHIEDWCGLSEDDRTGRFEQFIQADAARGIKLDEAPPLRMALFHWSERRWCLVWTFHHFCLDGWSVQTMISEILEADAAFSKAESPRLPPARQFRDFVVWLQNRRNPKSPAYWRRALGCRISSPPPLQADHAELPTWHDQHEQLTQEQMAKLAVWARNHGLTVNTVLRGAWAIAIARAKGDRHAIFGATVSGRPSDIEGIERMVGLFITAPPLAVDVREDMLLVDWLATIQREGAEVENYAHDTPGEIRQWLGLRGDTELFDSLLVFTNYPTAREVDPEFAPYALQLNSASARERTHLPLTLTVSLSEKLSLRLSSRTDHVTNDRAFRLLQHMHALLAFIADASPRQVGELVQHIPGEQMRLLEDWSLGSVRDTWKTDPCDALGRIARVEPTKLAVTTVDGPALDYATLERHSNIVAHRLRELGVGPETRVGLSFRPSPELLVALFAVMKSGAAYVPLDLANPRARLESIVRDSGLRLALVDEAGDRVLQIEGINTVTVAELVGSDSGGDPGRPRVGIHPNGLVYVIYTSGSTGTPRGCALPRGAFTNLLAWYGDNVLHGQENRVLALTSTGFDLTQKVYVTPLMFGGSVHLLDGFDPTTALQALQSEHITGINCTPSLFHALLSAAADDHYKSLGGLRWVALGGEAVTSDHLATWFAHAPRHLQLHNHYGPTECADVCVSATVRAGDGLSEPFPIGTPVWNARSHVLDGRGWPTPLGAAAELAIAGAGLARGYLGRPRETADRFRPDPFTGHPGARLYRTGDRVRWRDDQALEWLGRLDEQVKIRGQRIELGEIEAVLRRHPMVTDSVVNVHRNQSGDTQLVANIVWRGEEIPRETLRSFLREQLPNGMVPSVYRSIDELPFSHNGKLDRTELSSDTILPGPLVGANAPRGRTEMAVAEIWADVLSIPIPPREADFFELGGHSLKVSMVLTRVYDRLGVELPMRTIFETPQLDALASLIDRSSREPQSNAPAPSRAWRTRTHHAEPVR